MKKINWLMLIVVCGLLTGCQAIEPIENLYQLPQLPAEYTHLEAQIDLLLQEGAQYAAPASGSHLQAVQMVDLDGDGHQEALAFLRNDDQEKPLQIHIFDNSGEDFTPYTTIYGSGTQIYSVAYEDFNGDGLMELVVGWRVSADVQALSVYAFEGESVRELMTSDYVRYTLADLDSSGTDEVVVLRSDSEGQGDGLADVYQWGDGGLSMTNSASLSITMGELSQQGRVTQGTLSDGTPAIFVTGVTADGLGIVDILVQQEGILKNVALLAQTGVSAVIAPFRSLYPTDIDGDGYTEVPVAVALPSLFADFDMGLAMEYAIEWVHFDSQGQSESALATYHNAEQGWYLTLPDQWRELVSIERATISANEAAVVFYRMTVDESMQEAEAFLRISYYTGDNREYSALRGSQFILSRQTSAIVTAEFYEANNNWDTPLSEDELRNAFYTIVAEWTPGES